MQHIISSEAVGLGHPDKICDQIADLILDECLKQDPQSRVACEVFASNHLIIIGGEITTKAYVDVVQCAWAVLKRLRYTENDFTIVSNINKQSEDISKKIDLKDNKIGAGDQGLVFGYATDETEEFLPKSYVIANDILKILTENVDNGKLKSAKYDMKSLVSIDYQENKEVLDTLVVSIQHEPNIDLETFRQNVWKIIQPYLKKQGFNEVRKKYINYGGDFVIGGPFGDTGLTGRKIIADSYGAVARHGGGAYSGKDYTKIDRSGAYFARYIAKNVVAAGLAKRCEIELNYCIGLEKPVSYLIECFGTNTVDLEVINEMVIKLFDLDLSQIIKKFDLQHQCYFSTSVFGHFSQKNFPWEKTDLVEKIKKNLKKYKIL